MVSTSPTCRRSLWEGRRALDQEPPTNTHTELCPHSPYLLSQKVPWIYLSASDWQSSKGCSPHRPSPVTHKHSHTRTPHAHSLTLHVPSIPVEASAGGPAAGPTICLLSSSRFLPSQSLSRQLWKGLFWGVGEGWKQKAELQ